MGLMTVGAFVLPVRGMHNLAVVFFVAVKTLPGAGLIRIDGRHVLIFGGGVIIVIAADAALGFLQVATVLGAVESYITGRCTNGLGTVRAVAVETLDILGAGAAIRSGQVHVKTLSRIPATLIINGITVS